MRPRLQALPPPNSRNAPTPGTGGRSSPCARAAPRRRYARSRNARPAAPPSPPAPAKHEGRPRGRVRTATRAAEAGSAIDAFVLAEMGTGPCVRAHACARCERL
eukprot:2575703-Pleurochrysis_carterae.AAC.4